MVGALAYGTNHVVARQVMTEYTVAPIASFFALLFAAGRPPVWVYTLSQKLVGVKHCIGTGAFPITQ